MYESFATRPYNKLLKTFLTSKKLPEISPDYKKINLYFFETSVKQQHTYTIVVLTLIPDVL